MVIVLLPELHTQGRVSNCPFLRRRSLARFFGTFSGGPKKEGPSIPIINHSTRNVSFFPHPLRQKDMCIIIWTLGCTGT